MTVHSQAGTGSKTGVELRYHTKPEFMKLSRAQRSELIEWRNTPEGKKFTEKEKKARSGRPRSSNKDISAQIKSAIAEHMKEDETANIAEILASIKDTPAPTTDATVATPNATAANTASMEARTTALAQNCKAS